MPEEVFPSQVINPNSIKYFRNHGFEISFDRPEKYPYLHLRAYTPKDSVSDESEINSYQIGVRETESRANAIFSNIHPSFSTDEACINSIKSLFALSGDTAIKKLYNETGKIKIYVEDVAWLSIAEKIVEMY